MSIRFSMVGDNILQCVVEDNGIGRAAAGRLKQQNETSKTEHQSKGLSLVYNRLGILEKKYGKEFSVIITDKLNKDQTPAGTKVQLNVYIAG